MSHIIGISGKLQSGKTTSSNYIHGYLMKQNLVVENFKVDEVGKLHVTALFRNDDGSYRKEMGILDLDQKTPEFEQYASQFIWPIVKSYNLAESLKDVCMGLLGLSYQQCYGTNEDKNSLTELRWENMPGVTCLRDWMPVFDSNYSDTDIEYVTNVLGIQHREAGQMTAREVLQFVGTEIFRKMINNVWINATLSQIEFEQPDVAIIPDCRYLNEVQAIKDAGGIVIRLLRNPHNNTHISETELDSYENFDFVIDNTNLTIPESNTKLLQFLLEKGIVQPLNLD